VPWMEKIALVCSICCNSVYAGLLINNYDIFVIYHLLENFLTVIYTHCGEGLLVIFSSTINKIFLFHIKTIFQLFQFSHCVLSICM